MMKINQKHVKMIAIGAAIILPFLACKKKDTTNISTPPLIIGAKVADTTSGGTIKGTMGDGISPKTYNIKRDLFVNKGDTLLIQSGVTLCMGVGTNIFVKGTLISLGTSANPNWIHPCGVSKTDNTSQDASSDVAYKGMYWGGINCDTSCKLLVLKWTHVEFCGAQFTGVNGTAIAGIKSGGTSFGVLFQNANGIFDMEDSWIYGTADDGIRVQRGKINIMRNTFEKCGASGGEAFNMKGGTLGDVAYNLFVGAATNGSKLSNKNAGTANQSNVNMYNNTYIDCGFRQSSPTNRGGSVNYEGGSKGMCYNNLILNCRVGVRIVNVSATGDGPADTANMKYGNNYNYVDSIALANMIYPIGDFTKPQPTDIPSPSSFLPTGYTLGQVYDGSSIIGKNDPKFTGFTVHNYSIRATSFVGTSTFKLGSGSPAIGKGYTGFSALAKVLVNSNFGATEITAPGNDIGCFQTNGSGNKH